MTHWFSACLCLAAATQVAAQAPTAPHAPGIVGAAAGTGPWPAVAEVDPGLPTHTLYRPAKMPRARLPIIVWGNGACRDNGLAYAHFLREIASHGYLVVAVGRARFEEPMRAPLPETVEPVAPMASAGPDRPPDETQAAQLIDGLNWAVAQNAKRNSRYFDRLDVAHVAAMGHSCGGLQAIVAAADKRVATAMIWNSGVYNRGPQTGRSNLVVTKDQLKAIHGPVAYINGGPADIAFENAQDDFRRIEHVPALFAWQPVGHGGTFFTAPNGGAYAKLAVAWLDWQLKGDVGAARTFKGRRCGLCTAQRWSVERKHIR